MNRDLLKEQAIACIRQSGVRHVAENLIDLLRYSTLLDIHAGWQSTSGYHEMLSPDGTSIRWRSSSMAIDRFSTGISTWIVLLD